jgi:hypothetical protein
MAVQNVGLTVAKGLRAIMKGAFNDEPDNLTSFIPDKSSDGAYEEWTSRVGPGVAELKPKGEEFIEKDIIIKTPKRVWNQTWGLQVRVPFEDVDDDRYNVCKADAMDVGRAIKSRMAWERAMMLNTSFITSYITGYDGKALCASDHPLDISAYSSTTTDLTSEPSRSASTWSNVLPTASDLDFTSFNDACVLLSRTPSWEGDPMEIAAEFLIVSPENQLTADEITASSTRPDTANRADNMLKEKVRRTLTSNRLIDEDAWWVAVGPSKHDLCFFLRMGMKTKVNVDPTNWDYLTQAAVRFANGCFDPRGIVGTPGA